ncbi:hypothetical protein SAMN05216376_12063 [Mameliella alba]|uniref:hypothetical protein n=1 Tax=Mameliella alba TaxID=561184 RepID=UPI00088BFEF1|nr:hypothetical protein [Mameliella alba]OWV41876.1 hypothetical protein CDZ96_24370 [Mameliella alba]PTR35564.1 hypothetical protein LX94_04750 [Mameliella alba]GGF82972.1 hypothetical protein GCM10011319_48720 [Mameliella alba]SDE19893.1 hypothetical protein SAMN05216376_12063 [Mameliella alba]
MPPHTNEELAAAAAILAAAEELPELTPAEIKRLKRMAQDDARAEWAWSILRRWLIALGAVAAFVVALKNDLLELYKWISALLSR